MRPLAALLLLLLATEPTEPATRSELAQKKMSDGLGTALQTGADKLPKEKPQDPVSSGSFPVIPPAKKAKQNEVCC